MITEVEYKSIPEQERMNVILEGKVYYSCIHKPDLSGQKKFGSRPLYKTSMVLDDANKEKAKRFGIKIHEENESIPGEHVIIKRKYTEKNEKDGKTVEDVKPQVVDTAQNPIPEEILVGNGSTATVKFGTYWYDSAPKHGVGTVLFKMQVTELEVYNPDTSVDKDLRNDEDGFNINDVLAGNTAEEPAEEPEKEEKASKKDKKAAATADIFDD